MAITASVVFVLIVLFVMVGLDVADKLSSVFAMLAGLPVFAYTVYRDVSRGAAPGREAEDDAFRRLGTAVRKQWEDEAAIRSLWSPKPIRIRWSTTRRPVQASASAILGEDAVGGRPLRVRASGEGEDLAAAVRALPARQLVVIGEPGSGKTALAMRLVVNLLEHPGPDEPLPVLLPLSSWDLEVPLDAWMAERLVEDHDFLRSGAVAGRLIEDGRIMPVLDGLDEMDAALMPKAIKLIDQAVGDDRPLVVTCRSAEFENAVTASNRFFRRALVVELEPVELDDAVAFLRRMPRDGDERWAEVISWLREHPEGALAQALETPLMVDLLRDVYEDPDTDPKELFTDERFTEREAVEEHLLDRFVPAVYSEFHPDRRYTARQAGKWLGFLAVQLCWQGTRDLAWWRLRSPIVSVAAGLVVGFGGWLMASIPFGFWAGLLTATTTGVAAAVAAQYRWTDVAMDERRAADQRSILRRNLAASALVVAFAGAAVGGLIGFFFLGQGYEPSRFAGYLVTWAVLFGLGSGLSTAWGSYQLSRAWFALTGRIPFRLMTFVDHAHRRGVLRRAGAIHQFRHARLQDHLSGGTPFSQPADDREPAAERASQWWLSSVSRLAAVGLVTVLTLVIVAAASTVSGVDVVAGTRPKAELQENPTCDHQSNTNCTSTQVLTWRLAPGSAPQTTVFHVGKADSGRPVTSFGGSLSAGGCPGVDLRMTLVVNGERRTVSTARQGNRNFPDLGGLESKIGDRFAFTFQRLDSKPCDAKVVWTGPAAIRATLTRLRDRFGGTDS
ncbi:NACHT domain-containing protein [Actinomadura barringtoniae]|uniref:NACHT domain-containing protein n=1 Tax=Actinomadura barringtoniae TaxID=1427535 RepID=A0A939T4T6_9ACTN|nr:NACHT domain-containing protein [Actinomadura barringtoniae]MBO2452946.1 NACHT domain-containing protein [Actinomadura barringtoniae]